MKNVILFHPSVGYMDALRTKPSLPLNLLSAASIVSKYYDVRIIDERTNPHWENELKHKIDNETICVGVTSLTGKMIISALRFSKFVKKEYNLPIVWGGIHASLLPEQTLQNHYIDIVIVGEGEKTFFEIVQAIDKNLSLKNIRGIYYKTNGQINKTLPNEPLDLNSLPELPYHLIDLEQYLPLYKSRRSLYFESSRGCPFSCGYCYNTVFNKRKWRSLSPEETIRRIKNVVSKYPKIQDIYFVDDNFFVDLDRAKKIVLELKKLGLSWQVQGVDIISLKYMDDELLKFISESGCNRITIGIESGSQKMRKFMNKNGTKQDILDVFKRLAKYKIIIYTSFLVGLPTETKYDIKETVKLLFELFRINKNVRNSPFYIYTPYPGTPIFNFLLKQGYIMPKKLEDWANCEWDSIKNKKVTKFYEYLHFVTLFLDNKIKEYQSRIKILKIVYYLYRPIARFRVKNFFFKFMIEKYVFDFIKKYLKM